MVMNLIRPQNTHTFHRTQPSVFDMSEFSWGVKTVQRKPYPMKVGTKQKNMDGKNM